MAEFFDMGGYAAFVWGSYGMTAFLMVLVLVMAVMRHRRALRDVTRRAKHEMKQ